ncbi:helicase-exonuclease AddAB subunit AddA [Streptococcaceae bacterium ESL0729]|nr:helicase-exonuclease AddAB subunit AddA [Streptococcaceae bacterium ESL0729]
MTELKLTKEQTQAITDSGQNILVSASAGSGKTFVMVERIIGKIRQGIRIEDLFISTFTVKAASELRSRIDKKLREERRLSKDPVERQLFTQALQGLDTAHIGTTDAYTSYILKQFYYTIDLDPNYRLMADKAEQDVLKEETFTALFEDYLAGSDQLAEDLRMCKDRFTALAKNYSNDRNNKGFKEVIYKIHAFSESTEDPRAWLQHNFLQAANDYLKFTDLPDSFFEEWKKDVYDFITLMEFYKDSDLFTTKKQLEKVNSFFDELPRLVKAMVNNDLESFGQIFSGLDFDIRFGKTDDELIKEKREEFKAQKNSLVGSKSKPGSILKFINNLNHPSLVEEFSSKALPLLEDLQKVALAFYDAYLKAKLRENLLEYADINHLALKILKENESIRKTLADKYNEIMIDEYQDANQVQEALYQLISKGNNLFMVGDIKQSIYSFRQADSSLFLSKYLSYGQNVGGKLIRLKENFRSKVEVLSFTNSFFESLMDEKLGQMDYGEEEKLVFGSNEFSKDEDPSNYPELLLYHEEKDSPAPKSSESLENQSAVKNEIMVIANKIKELRAQGKDYKEMVILVRSKSNNNEIEDILTAMGIPVILDEGRNNYLESMEVRIMLESLRAIDNPLQDISLVALLNSPMFDFTEDDLFRISLQSEDNLPFYRKYQLVLEDSGQRMDLIEGRLRDKLQSFDQFFSKWITMSSKVSLHKLIWKIYEDTYYYEYVGAMENGSLRQANLQALLTRASSFEKNGYKGLYRFIKMIDKFLEHNNDLASVNIDLPDNSVRVMTIHKSKGLEFNYVFLMKVEGRFNEKDLNGKIILSKEKGLGSQYKANFTDRVTTDFPFALVNIETLAYKLNREENLRNSLAEEMRILYVAFTRTVKKLYIVSAISENKLKTKYQSAHLEQSKLDFKSRKNAKSYQDWLLALLYAYEGQGLLDIFEGKKLVSDQLKLIINLIDFSDGQEVTHVDGSFDEIKQELKEFDDELLYLDDVKEARRILDSADEMNEKYKRAINLPTIQTPSQIKKRYEKIIEVEPIINMRQEALHKFTLDVNDKVSPSELGSAVHEFMQLVDLDDTSLNGLKDTLARVAARKAVKKVIDLEKISTFFTSDFGQFMIENKDKLTREAPFSMLKTDSQASEQYLIRGIVDGFIKLKDKIILFDYKTDRFTSNRQIPKLEDRYRVQMELYEQALKMSYKIEKVEKYLILLGGPGHVITHKMD